MSSKEKVRCSHLLIKHNKSRNPFSRRSLEEVVISEEDARKELEEIQKVIDTSNFATMAKERSDCSSYKAGGDLGPFGRGQMQKPFEDASFNLKVGEISDIVSTDSGLHLIYRTG